MGRCIRAVDCAIDADCPAGALCASFIDRTTSCSTGIVGVACQKPSDGCVGDDCPLCTESATAGHRICEQASVGGCASF
ncbi:MAG TPA: hypothetical protein VH142_09855 [Polyangiaceae bacterium]|nr:hypothetical protein [Polyangiaceae bacterium]